jgi:TolB-like protein
MRRPFTGLGLLAFLPLFAGCAANSFLGQMTTSSYVPSNVYRADAHLSPEIKRVAVLPLTTLSDDSAMEFAREALGPVLVAELGRVRQFELVAVSAEELRLLTGRNTWSGEEKLPLDFFDKLRDKLGVDAVLFCRLTQYRAYEPLAVGWRLKLMDAAEPQVLWAVDEVFDARVPEVAAAARRYAQQHPDAGPSVQDAQGVLLSPRRFGRYAASAVVETLPGRAAQVP